MRRLVIWGASGHASVVADIVQLAGHYELEGFIEDGRGSTEGGLRAYRTLGGSDRLESLKADGVTHLIIAIGDNAARTRLAAIGRSKGLELATAIHPRATVAAGVSVGPGSVIAAGAVVNPGVVLGENVIINTLASVDHDCVLHDGVHVGPGCHIGGLTRIGRQAWLGIGSTTRDRVAIGCCTVVGAGAVVVNDLPDEVVAYGVPAKVIRKVGDDLP